MLKKLLLIMLLISTPAISFSMCNPCELTPTDPPSYEVNLSILQLVFPSSGCLAVVGGSALTIYPVDQNCILGTPSISVAEDVQKVVFSPDGNCLAVASFSNTITMFRLTGNCNWEQVGDPVPVSGNFLSIAYSPDGRCLAVGSDTNVTVFEVGLDCMLNPMPIATVPSNRANLLAFSPNGSCLVSAQSSFGVSLSIFSVERDQFGNCTGLGEPTVITDNITAPSSIRFSLTGDCLLVGNESGGGISVFEVDQDTCMLSYSNQLLSGSSIFDMVFSPFGDCLFAVELSFPGMIHIFNINPNCSFIETSTFNNPQGAQYLNVAISPNGRCFAIESNIGVNLRSLQLFSTNIVMPPVITQAMAQCDRTVRITGAAAPGLSVQVFVDGSPLGGSVVVGAGGTFEATVGPLTPGMHTITAVATNIDTGCSSVISNAVEVTVTAGPIITNIRTTCLNTVIISGTAVPGIPVSIFIDDNPTPIGMGLPNNQGIFSVATQPVVSGPHCFTAVQAGCPSALPVCVNITGQSCTLSAPNLAFGTHCNV